MLENMKRFVADVRGVTAMEYGLIAATTVVAIIAALALIGPALANIFGQIAAAL